MGERRIGTRSLNISKDETADKIVLHPIEQYSGFPANTLLFKLFNDYFI